MSDEIIRTKAIQEFFKVIVHAPVDWNSDTLECEGWNNACPNLIKLLKGD